MLVLSRKVDEVVHIGKDIEVRILGVNGDIVSIGIEAPKSVEILRGELIDTTSELNREAVIVDEKIFK